MQGPSASHSKSALFQSPAASNVGFKPKVTSTSQLNLNFGAMYGKDKSVLAGTKTPSNPVPKRKSSAFSAPRPTAGEKPLFTIGKSDPKKSVTKKPVVKSSISKENVRNSGVGVQKRKSIGNIICDKHCCLENKHVR